ncbi:MAG: hypothetical protein BWY83_00042 [bacterium ADurb.Bin478]|nr:MAG: hypothetical protein BWY83_00042 [bacterium ADurb.Bin478]
MKPTTALMAVRVHRYDSRLVFLILCTMLSCVAWADERPRPPWMQWSAGHAPLIAGHWPQAEKFSFAVLGDKTSGGEGKWPIFDRAVHDINQLAPDFVMTVGDQIPGHMHERELWNAEWEEYLSHARSLRAPLFFTVGNHDIANLDCYRWWQEDRGSTYYSFIYRGCLFLVINTEEERTDGRGPVWQKMMTFVENELVLHRDARHTFLFMHKPMWDDARYELDWRRITAALGERRYTAFAGHVHTLDHQRRGCGELLTLGATGAGTGEIPVKAMGEFHHFASVVVDGDTTHISIVEPGGAIWPRDVAPRSFKEALNGLGRMEIDQVTGLGDQTLRCAGEVVLRNTLEDTAQVAMRLRRLGQWKIAVGDTPFVATLAPGQERRMPCAFTVCKQDSYDPVWTAVEAWRQGMWLSGRGAPLPLYRESQMVVIENWMLIGPWQLGRINRRHLPHDPGRAIPGVFDLRGPDRTFDANAVYRDGGRELRWKPARCNSEGLISFNAEIGTLDDAMGYALCGVYSPVDQLVYARYQADNFAYIVLNGKPILDAALWRSGVTGYAPLALKTGWNRLLVKLINDPADWYLQFHIGDPLGNLRFAPHPPQN